MNKPKRKGYISFEIIILFAIVVLTGISAIWQYKESSNDSNELINKAFSSSLSLVEGLGNGSQGGSGGDPENPDKPSQPENACALPEGTILADKFEFQNGIYIYTYNQTGESEGGNWHVELYDKSSTAPVVEAPCTTINNIPIKDMGNMFLGSQAVSFDFSQFNTVRVENMSYMFMATTAEKINLDGLDGDSLKNVSYMFNYSQVKEIDISGFNTSKVENFDSMFDFTSGLKKLVGTETLDTGSAVSMNNMFRKLGIRAGGTEPFSVANFDVRKVTGFKWTFAECRAEVTGLENWKTESATNMERMFADSMIKKFNLIGFDTSKITNMNSMFSKSSMYDNSTTIEVFNISSFDTSNVESMDGMFEGLPLSSIDVKHFDTSKVMSMAYMFSGMTNITSLDLSSFDMTSVTDTYNMFENTPLTSGYARSQADALKLNSSENKPTIVTFIVK